MMNKILNFSDPRLLQLKCILHDFVLIFTAGPDILITGEDRVVCGDSARFDAEVKRAQLSEWSITWQKKIDDISRKIDTSDKKYKGSTRRQLVIQSVCKDDEAEYQAILSNGSKLNITSNSIYLQTLGGIFYH